MDCGPVGPWARRLFRSCAPKANKNWNNAHNFYGDPKDLDATNLTDAKSFFQTYHAPNNAVLAVVGDFEPAAAKAWVEKCYGPIPSAPQPPKPDPTEPRQEREQEQRSSQDDELATKPALAFAYHMPDRNTPEYYALILLDQILLHGNDSRLYQALVQRGYFDGVSGGINAVPPSKRAKLPANTCGPKP